MSLVLPAFNHDVAIHSSDHEQKKKLETDPMYKLEHGVGDQEKLKIAVPTLSNIQDMQSAWKDDFAINSMLRKKFRVGHALTITVREQCCSMESRCCNSMLIQSLFLLPRNMSSSQLAH